MPRVRYFTTGIDRWQTAADWPLPDAKPVALHLRSGGRLTTAASGGDEAADRYVSDPADPVPTVGSATFLPGLLMARDSGHRTQAEVERAPTSWSTPASRSSGISR
jgi:uncharacterized protein